MSASFTPHRSEPRFVQRLAWLTVATSVPALALVALVVGYQILQAEWIEPVVVTAWLAAVGISTAYQGVLVRRALKRVAAARALLVDGLLLLAIVACAVVWKPALMGLFVFVRQALVTTRIYLATDAGERTLINLLAQPAKLLAVSFLILIAIGTVFLTFPRATTDGEGADLVDAAFTATSATCVTGLAVLNTNDDPQHNPARQSFSTFGQLVLFLLIQVGGLGIMTLSAAVVLFLGSRLGMKSQVLLQQVLEEGSRRDLERSVRFIVAMTFGVELLGAVILFFRFWGDDMGATQAAAHALFMSVSAYCNAGFSLWSDSLVSFRNDPVVMWTIMGLITVGGLGYLVVAALVDRSNFSRSPGLSWRRWSIQVKVVLLLSACLVVGGGIIYYFLEFHHSLAGLGRSEKLMASLFQSVTMRTAGFNTVDFANMSRVGMVCMLLLMFIGGSSGSTAGGVKTTTVAVVFLGVRAMLMGRDDVEVGGRTIPKSIVYKSISILVIFAGLFVVGLLALLFVEPNVPFEALLFETMSALATVGVSTGITPDLGTPAKLVITFLMFVGRIGPLTLALAVGEQSRHIALRYPQGKIMVG